MVFTSRDCEHLHAIWSRRRLIELSKVEIPDYIEYPETSFEKMLVSSEEDGKKSFDTDAAKQNIKQIGEKLKIAAKNTHTRIKQSAKEISEKATIKLDAHVQKKVDNVIWTFIKSHFIHWTFGRCFGPISCNIWFELR